MKTETEEEIREKRCNQEKLAIQSWVREEERAKAKMFKEKILDSSRTAFSIEDIWKEIYGKEK